jgi:hypothetical protein
MCHLFSEEKRKIHTILLKVTKCDQIDAERKWHRKIWWCCWVCAVINVIIRKKLTINKKGVILSCFVKKEFKSVCVCVYAKSGKQGNIMKGRESYRDYRLRNVYVDVDEKRRSFLIIRSLYPFFLHFIFRLRLKCQKLFKQLLKNFVHENQRDRNGWQCKMEKESWIFNGIWVLSL